MRLRLSRKTLGVAAVATGVSVGTWQFKPALAQKENVPSAGKEALSTRATVGLHKDGVVLPQNQVLTPAGRQIALPGMRPQALALSPDGRLLVTAGQGHELVVLNLATGEVLQRVPLPSVKGGADTKSEGPVSRHILEPDTNGQLSYSGIVFSPDGTRLYLSSVNGSVKVFEVAAGKVSGLNSFDLPKTGLPRRQQEIPCGLAVSSDGTRLYVAGNLSNRLFELDAVGGRVLRHFDVGVAPYDVVLTGDKAYISNWGGRRPDEKSITGPAGRGTKVRVDGKRFIASEGSVSVIDLKDGEVERELVLGRHACAMVLSPDKRFLVVANAGEDMLSVFDTLDDKLVETIGLRVLGALYGAVPDALTFSPSGQSLFVCLGGRNAVASIGFKPGKSQMRGLIPVGWFPGAVVYDAKRRTIGVANIKGTGSGRGPKFNTYQYNGTLSLVPLPDAPQMGRFTRAVLENARQATIDTALLPARPNQPPRPVPERVGEPSTIKHVVYIIKENRTYDQVLGDIKEGNGDASGCIFGADVTPNQHKMVREFALLDNTYCSGVLSADGHQWADTGFATDYMERSFAGFPRSYPDGMEDNDVDALAYAPSGFIWDNAIRHGKTLRDYGEFAIGSTGWEDATRKGSPRFADFMNDYLRDTRVTKISSTPAVESLRPYLCNDTIGWNMQVPDVLRAARFIGELKQFEKKGTFPQMVLICLPNDHTSGTSAGSPTPAAHIADNDLAMGQIVEAISHSRFWKDTCIFAIEDDPQAGWDHVSAYRTTAYVVSPYTKRHAVVSTQYNQPGLLRTMELMLGLPPMNVMDAAATPLSDCFTSRPDFTPFKAVPSKVPLSQMNPAPSAIRDPLRRRYALLSAKLPLKEADKCPEDLLNRILWNARKGSAPYPVRNPKDGLATQRDDDDD
ncbi:phosphoesterase [bacterium]|nr:MAG: phosphoesterase [bacterium]